jgi:hypothetical protein
MVKTAPKPHYLVADCKLYHKDNAEFLSQLTFITHYQIGKNTH